MTTTIKNAFGFPEEVWATIAPTLEKYEGKFDNCELSCTVEEEGRTYFNAVDWKVVFVIDGQAYACAPTEWTVGFLGINYLFDIEDAESDENGVLIKPTEVYKFIFDEDGEVVDEVLVR